MKRPSVLLVSTPDDLALGACSLVARAEREALDGRGEFRMAVAAGPLVGKVMGRLVASRGVHPGRWRLFAASARWPSSWGGRLPAGDDRHGGIPGSGDLAPLGAHGIDLGAGSPERAAALYDTAIRRLAPPGNGPGRFDLVLLELGGQGEVAGLAPGSSALVAPHGALVVAAWDPTVSAWLVTLTAEALSSAGRVVVLASGEDRARALSRVLDGDDATPAPASRLRPSRGTLTFLADEAAAARLKKLDGTSQG